MTKGELVSRGGDGKRYMVNFDLKAVGKTKKHPVVGTAVIKTDFPLLVASIDGTPIPEGDYDLHPESSKYVYHVVKSKDNWSVVSVS